MALSLEINKPRLYSKQTVTVVSSCLQKLFIILHHIKQTYQDCFTHETLSGISAIDLYFPAHTKAYFWYGFTLWVTVPVKQIAKFISVVEFTLNLVLKLTS